MVVVVAKCHRGEVALENTVFHPSNHFQTQLQMKGFIAEMVYKNQGQHIYIYICEFRV